MTTSAGDQHLRPISGRTPLKPINSPVVTPSTNTISKPKPKVKLDQECIGKNQNQIPSVAHLYNKEENENENENKPVRGIEPLETSLAEELGAIRKKLERLRMDKDRTEKIMNERETKLDLQMKELQRRGEYQKMLEIEVDRLYRLNELKSYCLRVSSVRSLREKQQEKKIPEPAANSQDQSTAADEEESVGDNTTEMESTPCSASSETATEKGM